MELKRLFLGLVALGSLSASAATLDQLAAIQTLLRVEAYGTPVCTAELAGVPKEQTVRMPQLLEAQVREKLGALSATDRKNFFSDSARIDACASRCRCGIYADWIGADAEFADLKVRLLAREKKAAKSEAPYATCARANQEWICRNPVYRALLKGDE